MKASPVYPTLHTVIVYKYVHVHMYIHNTYVQTGYTVKSPNKDCLGQPLLSFVRGSPSLGGSNCIVIIGKKYFVVSSRVLCIEKLSLFCSVHYQRFYRNSYVNKHICHLYIRRYVCTCTYHTTSLDFMCVSYVC